MNNWKYNIAPNQIITTSIGDIFIDNDGILIIKYLNNLDFELEMAVQAIEVCEKITNGEKVLVLINTGEFGSMNFETRKFLSSQRLEKHRKAVALVINSLQHRMIAHFIINIRRNYYPTKIFKTECEGLKWLKTFIN